MFNFKRTVETKTVSIVLDAIFHSLVVDACQDAFVIWMPSMDAAMIQL